LKYFKFYLRIFEWYLHRNYWLFWLPVYRCPRVHFREREKKDLQRVSPACKSIVILILISYRNHNKMD
jgi:hypothetical protein